MENKILGLGLCLAMLLSLGSAVSIDRVSDNLGHNVSTNDSIKTSTLSKSEFLSNKETGDVYARPDIYNASQSVEVIPDSRIYFNDNVSDSIGFYTLCVEGGEDLRYDYDLQKVDARGDVMNTTDTCNSWNVTGLDQLDSWHFVIKARNDDNIYEESKETATDYKINLVLPNIVYDEEFSRYSNITIETPEKFRENETADKDRTQKSKGQKDRTGLIDMVISLLLGF